MLEHISGCRRIARPARRPVRNDTRPALFPLNGVRFKQDLNQQRNDLAGSHCMGARE